MKKAYRYRMILALCFLVPAILCQTVLPVIPLSFWESLAEGIYAHLLRGASPNLANSSKVLLLEVDQRTLDTYGWPIDRSHYIKALNRLKTSGHPWVLSLLQFQALDKRRGAGDDQTTISLESQAKDAALAAEIKSYERYVGSGLEVSQGSVLDALQEDELLPRILLSSTGRALGDLPELPLRMAEDDQFVRAEKAFGYSTRFGTEPTIHCMQTYITDSHHRGDFLILSSLVWTAALATQSRIETAAGANWPRQDESGSLPRERAVRVAYKTCDAFPGMLTTDYLAQRSIERVSLADFLEDQDPRDLNDKVILLASAEMRRFRGPGIESGQKTAVVPEQLLAARFLDGFLAGYSIKRDRLKESLFLGVLPLILGGILFALSFVMPLKRTLLVTAAMLAALVAIARVYLFMQDFIIPAQAIMAMSCCLLFQVGMVSYLKYYGVKRQMKFTEKINQALSQCNTLAEIENLTRDICQAEFKAAKLIFCDYDADLYAASANPKTALEHIERRKTIERVTALNGVDATVKTVLLGGENIAARTQGTFLTSKFSTDLVVESSLGRLGTARLAIEFEIYEQDFVGDLVNILRFELAQHWHRIKLLVDQKILDYQILAEQSRGKIMGRFLTKMLVSKFSDTRTMDENFKAVLTPRLTRTALMQADIRGYSKVAAQMSAENMVALLQGYFRQVVDAAQLVAQVKLIGDCIFLFIEEDPTVSDQSPVDQALEIAKILIEVTEAQNERLFHLKGLSLNFGIAIHYGEAVVGNLSSDHCIDYTAIGTNVNLVARLEEMTKHQSVSSIIGPNGVLLSEDAKNALRKYKAISPIPMDLQNLNVSVRSFNEIKLVYGLTSQTVKSSDITSDLDQLHKSA